MKKNLLEEFGKLVIEARNSGLLSLKNLWLSGWRPKSGKEEDDIISQFLEGLAEDEKKALLVTVAHFVDESFDKLMSIIENGEASYDIDIRIRDAETTEALEVGGNDIQVLFWKWLQKFGANI